MGLQLSRAMAGAAEAVLTIMVAVTAAGCQQAAPSLAPSPRATVSPSGLAACPTTLASPGPQVLIANLPSPDDLAFNLDGRLLFSDLNTGTVSALGTDGSVERIASGLSAPEGIVVEASGRILVAEQGRNRVMAIDPRSHAMTLWRAFPNRTGSEGIDGIGPELSNGDIVVPDSPNGVLWRVSADGKTATQIASGMVRPVGAAVDASRRIFIADEGGALWVLDPARHRFATLLTPDDVVVSREGHVFVNTLGDNAIHELDAQGHPVSVIAGLQLPQGIALDTADNLYYTELSSGRIDRVVRTFALDPPNVSRTPRGTFIICPVIHRAQGFSRPLGLSVGSSASTSVVGVVQPGTDSSGAFEVQTSANTITINVSVTTGSDYLALSQPVQLSP